MAPDEYLFKSPETPSDTIAKKAWKILIVDDDHSIHDVTKLVLKNMMVNDRALSFTSVYSAEEAKELLAHDSSFVVALIDVVMETSNAGLELTQYIRQELLNPDIRLIIRTGQSGLAPVTHVIDNYDINDYKEKTELTSEKLYSAIKLAIMNFNEIQNSKIEKEDLYKQVLSNPLTHLNNRHKLDLDLLDSKDITLILLNIDRFSHINDLYGYEQGNHIIKEIANSLNLLQSTGSKLYHIGIDEFLLVRKFSSVEETDKVVSLIQERCQNNHFTYEDIDFNITLTIGIVENEDKNLLNKANLAVKEARLISPNRIQRYNSDMKVVHNIEKNLTWFKKIKHALNEDRMVPYFQAIYNNHTKKIEKYECLVRMIEDEKVISPFHFLEVAQETGLLSKITYMMLEKSALVFSQNSYQFSINITAHDLQDENFSSFVQEVLQKHNIDPSRLILEILENNSLDNIEHSRENISTLQKIGCRISLDDFGAECQNFSNILNLNLDTIKIDGFFIKNLKDEMSYKMVDSIVYFAKNVGIDLVAEFVCDKEIFDLVNQFGIKYSQGYYISEPQASLCDKEDPLS